MLRPTLVLIGVVALGAIALTLVAATSRDQLAFTLGVTNGLVAADLRSGDVACQAPVAMPDADATFDRVVFSLGTYRRPGPPVDVTLRPARGGPVLAQGQLAGGYPDVDRAPSQAVVVGHVSSRAPMRVCLRNRGPGKVAVYGNAGIASRTSSATVDGKAVQTDLNLRFERFEPRSLLSLAGAMARRAALFRASWFGAWTYALAALLVLVAVPTLLVLALRTAAAESSH
jgi:hypothetical protein